MLVDAPREEVQLGTVERSVIVDPAPHLSVNLTSETNEARATATVEVPVPDLLADRLLRLGANGWRETHKVPVPTPSPASPKGVAEEVETGVLRFSSTIRVFAVHDLRLVGM
jgi:hypothetical protein